jgi:hypothetical protein
MALRPGERRGFIAGRFIAPLPMIYSLLIGYVEYDRRPIEGGFLVYLRKALS